MSIEYSPQRILRSGQKDSAVNLKGGPTGQDVTVNQKINDGNALKHLKHVIYVEIPEFIMILKGNKTFLVTFGRS